MAGLTIVGKYRNRAFTTKLLILDSNLVAQNNFEIADHTIQVYPNPSFSQFRIESAQKIKKTTAFDVLGKEVSLQSLTNNQFSIEKSGIYFLILELENGSVLNKKIIIQQ
jgi:hypothetical protein